jgi:predicted nucleic acid-binding protein
MMIKPAMKPVLIDSCIIIDLIADKSDWYDWSLAQLVSLHEAGPLAINQIIFAEISSGYDTPAAFRRAIEAFELMQLSLPWEAAFLAGAAYRTNRQRGGNRRSPLPDFYIGAHAATSELRLLTRDAARYETYFPTIQLITPGS